MNEMQGYDNQYSVNNNYGFGLRGVNPESNQVLDMEMLLFE
jgi:hypothetical protein